MNEYLINAEVTFTVTANSAEEAKALLVRDQQCGYFVVRLFRRVSRIKDVEEKQKGET